MRTKKSSSFVGVVASPSRTARGLWKLTCLLATATGVVAFLGLKYGGLPATMTPMTCVALIGACAVVAFVAATRWYSPPDALTRGTPTPELQTTDCCSDSVAYQQGFFQGMFLNWD